MVKRRRFAVNSCSKVLQWGNEDEKIETMMLASQ